MRPRTRASPITCTRPPAPVSCRTATIKRIADTILGELVDLKPDGSIRMDMAYFNYCQGLTMTNAEFDRLFGGAARRPGVRRRHP